MSNTRTAPELMMILVCPQTRSGLSYDSEGKRLVSVHAKCAYPIIDHMPVCTSDAAIALTEAELLKWRGHKR